MTVAPSQRKNRNFDLGGRTPLRRPRLEVNNITITGGRVDFGDRALIRRWVPMSPVPPAIFPSIPVLTVTVFRPDGASFRRRSLVAFITGTGWHTRRLAGPFVPSEAPLVSLACFFVPESEKKRFRL